MAPKGRAEGAGCVFPWKTLRDGRKGRKSRARAERIIRRNLDEAEYMIYKLMRKDPNHVYLINYPDQKKLKEAKMDIKKIFERHRWMRRLDVKMEW